MDTHIHLVMDFTATVLIILTITVCCLFQYFNKTPLSNINTACTQLPDLNKWTHYDFIAFSTHVGVGKRDTDERAKIAIQEVTRMLEPNSLSSLEGEDADDIEDMPKRSILPSDVTERVRTEFNFNEDTLLSTVDDGTVLTTIS